MEIIHGNDKYKDFAITVENNQGKVFTIQLLDSKGKELLTKKYTIQPKVEYQRVNSSDDNQTTTRETYQVSLANNDSPIYVKTRSQKASESGNPPEIFYGVALERSLGSETSLIPPETEEMMPLKHGTAHISYKSYTESIEINKERPIRGTEYTITIKYRHPTGLEPINIPGASKKSFTVEDIEALITELREKHKENPFINTVIVELESFKEQLKARNDSDKEKLKPLSFKSLEGKTEKSLAEIINKDPNVFIEYLESIYQKELPTKTNVNTYKA